ncbi:zinc-binding dehydrogenase [Streptomyces sp. NPDC002666]
MRAIQIARHGGPEVLSAREIPQPTPGAGEVRLAHPGRPAPSHTPADLPRRTYTAVLDTAGIDTGPALAPGGRYISIADHPLPDIPGAAKSYVQEDQDHLAQVAALVDRGELRPRIAYRYPFHDVRSAHERFEAGGVLGKILLTF